MVFALTLVRVHPLSHVVVFEFHQGPLSINTKETDEHRLTTPCPSYRTDKKHCSYGRQIHWPSSIHCSTSRLRVSTLIAMSFFSSFQVPSTFGKEHRSSSINISLHGLVQDSCCCLFDYFLWEQSALGQVLEQALLTSEAAFLCPMFCHPGPPSCQPQQRHCSVLS